MQLGTVALVKYDQTPNALRKALELCDGFEKLKPTDKVLIKPNAGQGLRKTQPPNGVVTTTIVLVTIQVECIYPNIIECYVRINRGVAIEYYIGIGCARPDPVWFHLGVTRVVREIGTGKGKFLSYYGLFVRASIN